MVHEPIVHAIIMKEATASLHRLRRHTVNFSKVSSLDLGQNKIVFFVLEQTEVGLVCMRVVLTSQMVQHALTHHARLAVARQVHRRQLSRVIELFRVLARLRRPFVLESRREQLRVIPIRRR